MVGITRSKVILVFFLKEWGRQILSNNRSLSRSLLVDELDLVAKPVSFSKNVLGKNLFANTYLLGVATSQ